MLLFCGVCGVCDWMLIIFSKERRRMRKEGEKTVLLFKRSMPSKLFVVTTRQNTQFRRVQGRMRRRCLGVWVYDGVVQQLKRAARGGVEKRDEKQRASANIKFKVLLSL